MSEAPGADTLELERLPADLVDLAGHVMSLAIGYGVTAARPDVLASYVAAKAEFLRRLAAERAEKEELRRERDEARAPKLWCLACGTVTQDRQCDCTIFDETADLQNLVNYEDELRSEARKAHARAEAAESLLAEAGKALGDLIENNRKGVTGETARRGWMVARTVATAVQSFLSSSAKGPEHG